MIMASPETDPAMLAKVSVWDFVTGFFGKSADFAWGCQSLAGDAKDYRGDFLRPTIGGFDDHAVQYISIAAMKPGSKSRNLKNFNGLHMVTLDDVGVISDTTDALMSGDHVRMFAPPPTAIVETSRANYQVSFRIEPPEMDEERATLFLEAVKQTPFGPGVQPMSAVHYVRLPAGENIKKAKKGFKTKLKSWDPTAVYTLDEMAGYFGLPSDWDTPKPKATKLGPRETVPNETVIAVMELIPNDHSTFPKYDDWIRAGQIFKGSAEEPDDMDLQEAWVDWSSQMIQAKADPAVKWETFTPDLTHAGSLRNLVATHASHPKEGDPDFKAKKKRAEAADKLNLQPKPTAAFTVVPTGTLPPPTKAAVKQALDGVLDKITAARTDPTEY